MKKDLFEICLLLDRSGSMSNIEDDVIGGVNTFLNNQKKNGKVCNFSLIQFDHEYETPQWRVPLAEARDLTDLTYVPRGSTALLDAIGRGINELGAALRALPESERPEKVIFVIMTDGLENASQKFRSKKEILGMIEHQKTVYSWEFLFLGANQDAIDEASQLGIDSSRAIYFCSSPEKTRRTFTVLSNSVTRSVSGGAIDFTSAERKDIE